MYKLTDYHSRNSTHGALFTFSQIKRNIHVNGTVEISILDDNTYGIVEYIEVYITNKNGNNFTGYINSYCIEYSHLHGYEHNDIISFHINNVYSVCMLGWI